MSAAEVARTPAVAPTVTAAVIATNEAANIGACLAALAWADARLVLDGGSTDGTPELAARGGAAVRRRPFDTFPRQRNAALDLVETDWTLFVDADERVTPALAAEVRARVAAGGPKAGYWIPRRNLILGRWIRGGGWYPDEQLRLLRTGRARYDEAVPVHEVVRLDGPAGHLREPLVHHNYTRWSQLFAKQAAYSRLEAARLRREGVRPLPHRFVLQPLREFRRRYVTLRGYRDGWRGLLLATLMAAYTFDTFRRLAVETPSQP